MHVLPATLQADAFKAGYAAALNAARGGGQAVFEYRAFVECDFFHGSRSFRARASGKEYAELRQLLAEEHRKDAVLGCGRRTTWYGSELAAAICAGSAHGFVAVAGGRESARDKVSHLFSFVPQRSTVGPEEIGDATRRQIETLYGPGSEKAAAVLDDYTKRTFTLTKSYADLGRGGVLVMSTTLFRWLVQHRNFCDFEIRHFLAYAYRDYLGPYLLNNLRARQAERAKPDGGSALMSEALKLISNSYYGYLGLQATNYPKTRLRRGSTLCNQPLDRLRRMQSLALVGCVPERVNRRRQARRRRKKLKALRQAKERRRERAATANQLAELGNDKDDDDDDDDDDADNNDDNTDADVEDNDDDDDDDDDDVDEGDGMMSASAPRRLELLYAATSSNSEGKIRNLIQVSAAILSNSKRIYFSHVFFLLDTLSSKEVEKCYFDTDSCILAAHRYSLRDMVAYGKEEAFATGLDAVLYSEDSGQEPFGKFKYDARATRGLFHSPKCYLLRGPGPSELDDDDDDDDAAAAPAGGDEESVAQPASLEVKRFKGCSRAVQKELVPEHFALDLGTGLSQPAFANRSRLAATPGFQMLVQEESRRLVSPVNLKRRYDVRCAPSKPSRCQRRKPKRLTALPCSFVFRFFRTAGRCDTAVTERRFCNFGRRRHGKAVRGTTR